MANFEKQTVNNKGLEINKIDNHGALYLNGITGLPDNFPIQQK